MPSPFEPVSLEAIPVLERMYEVCWEEEFGQYIKNNYCAERWAYSLIETDGESYTWNRIVCYSIASDGIVQRWFLEAITQYLPPEVVNDLDSLQIGYPVRKVEDHPYLKAAIKWHNDHRQQESNS